MFSGLILWAQPALEWLLSGRPSKLMKRIFENVSVCLHDVKVVVVNPPTLVLVTGEVLHIDTESARSLLSEIQSLTTDSTAEIPAISSTVKHAATDPSSL